MPDKKQKKLKILGGFLLVIGFITLASSVFSLVSGSRQLRQTKALIDQQLTLITGAMKVESSQLAQIEQIRQDLGRRFSELEQLLESPGIRFGYSFQGLLGLGTIFAGLGFVKRRSWVVNLVMVQAVFAVIFYIWWLLASPLVAYQDSLSALMFSLLARAVPWTTQAQIDKNMRMTQLFTQWGSLFFIILWNGFLFWVVRKPSVRAACGVK